MTTPVFNAYNDKDGPHIINRKLFDDYVKTFGEKPYEIIARKVVVSRTKKQLGAHFGLMIMSAIEQANDMGLDTSSFLKEIVRDDLPSGIGLTKDFLKTIFYALCPMHDDNGKRITLSNANIEQASKHFSDCCTLLAAHNIYVEEPNPNYQKR